jgi:3-deoxy-D-manno-octulosonate 8-phosphate phosphatase (KDO 8-P phosphatase)
MKDFGDSFGQKLRQYLILDAPSYPVPMQLNSPLTDETLHQLASNIKILLMDVDGVLTDGRLYLVPDRENKMVESKGFDSQDGIALRWLTWFDIKTGVISGRESPATSERARQVGMTWVFQGHIEKIPLLEQILAEAKISPKQVAYIGDDWTDTVVMRRVGLSIATANARPEVKRVAMATTDAPGGQGAVREVVELLLKAQGHWASLLKKYEIEA